MTTQKHRNDVGFGQPSDLQSHFLQIHLAKQNFCQFSGKQPFRPLAAVHVILEIHMAYFLALEHEPAKKV